jgi:hypothetical protein
LASLPAVEPRLEPPTPRKRAVVRYKPARMIDDAVRRRAIEAVERAMSMQDAST